MNISLHLKISPDRVAMMLPANRTGHCFLLLLLFVLTVTFITDAGRNLYSDTQIPSKNNLSASITQPGTALLKRSIVPLHQPDDYNSLIKLAGQVPYVLIGDSTHGTHEFYQQRIDISKRLIQEKNFKLIVLEGDWPNVYSLNQYVQAATHLTAEQALNATNPDVTWLWNNREMLNFIQWLRGYNDQLPGAEQKVSLLGMDIYSFEKSKALVIDYLQSFSPLAAQQARQRYQCFDRFNNDLHRYGQAVSEDLSLSCEREALEQYLDFSACRFPCPQQNPFIEREAFFYALQNARVIKNSEKSLRTQYLTGDETKSWNQRDRHMLESFLAMSAHLQHPKTVLWAHSSHLGDARATEMAEQSLLNVGQLLRQHFKRQVFAIGMLTYSGTVMAADSWNMPAKIKTLLAAHPDSNEALFHRLGIPRFVLHLHQSPELIQFLNKSRLQRHVGVVYLPQKEMESHYSYTHLADQFDAIVYTDYTTAVTP